MRNGPKGCIFIGGCNQPMGVNRQRLNREYMGVSEKSRMVGPRLFGWMTTADPVRLRGDALPPGHIFRHLEQALDGGVRVERHFPAHLHSFGH